MANKGDIYEGNVYKQYKQLKLVPAGFSRPSPGGHGIDCKLFINNYNYLTPMSSKEKNKGQGMIIGIELKLNQDADFGQSGVRYNQNWELHGENDGAAVEKRAILKAAGAEQIIRREWASKIPNIKKGKFSTRYSDKERQEDVNRFSGKGKEIYYSNNVFSSLCAKYYLAKQCPYINISSHGLYHMGTDPAGLGKFGVKSFTSSVNMGLRVRLKESGKPSKSTGKTSLTFNASLKIDSITASPINLDDPDFADKLQEDAMMCRNAPSDLALLRALLL
jgi:hypothetical protein